MELIKRLTDQMGISQTQAHGGVRVLLRLAKGRLTASEYARLSDKLPGPDPLVDAVSPAGAWISGLTGAQPVPGSLIEMVDGFSRLGLDFKIIRKFVSIVLSFVREQGGDGVEGILSKVLA